MEKPVKSSTSSTIALFDSDMTLTGLAVNYDDVIPLRDHRQSQASRRDDLVHPNNRIFPFSNTLLPTSPHFFTANRPSAIHCSQRRRRTAQ